MVQIEYDHLRSAAGGAARLDGACGPIADLEEAHQAGRFAAAGERLAFAAQVGKIASGSAAILEYACLTDPQVHDAAFVDQIIVDRLDEASVRGRALIRARRTRHLTVA